MSDEINNDVNLEAPVAEQTVEAPKTPEFDGLSNRAALEEAIKINREGKEPDSAPTTKEVAQAVASDPEPPSEFSSSGKAAWRAKDLGAIQKEYKRIHDSRTLEISRAQKAEREAREDAKTWRELGKMAAPYIEARGSEGVSPDKAIMEALALINEFKKGDPAAVKAELRKIGIDLDKAPGQTAAPTSDPKIEALQKTVDELKKDKDQQEFQKIVGVFESAFDTLAAQKTRTGDTVFPGLLDSSEEGKQFASELGSLTQEPWFVKGVLRRFPNADFVVVVREAYKHLGGKVSGEPVKVSTTSQQHTERSRRASAAVPGRVAPRVDDSNLVGKLSNRAALAKAIEIHKER